jgi:hypothetical protein
MHNDHIDADNEAPQIDDRLVIANAGRLRNLD